jgi:hypothetical protein
VYNMARYVFGNKNLVKLKWPSVKGEWSSYWQYGVLIIISCAYLKRMKKFEKNTHLKIITISVTVGAFKYFFVLTG